MIMNTPQASQSSPLINRAPGPLKATGRKRVLIIGGGFAGLNAALQLKNTDAIVTIIDRKNHHTFQPLLYQVATATLTPADIAQPIRNIVGQADNIAVLMSEVNGIDSRTNCVHLSDGSLLDYDYLILATGATHSYFGHDEWQPIAPGLKTVEDALKIRRQVFTAFEAAEREVLLRGHHKPLNFIVIGGGPTGVELAGALADSCRLYCKNFRGIDASKSRVLLIEAIPKILAAYPDKLSASALEQLKQIGVEVMLNTQVTAIEPGLVRTNNGDLDATVVLWAAGVKASPLGKMLGGEIDKRGCVMVDANLNPPGKPNVFVCGDLAHFEQDGKQVPGVAQTAIQMGTYAGQQILADMRGQARKPFCYRDKGDMATIGRMKAVANIRWPFKAVITGGPAWFSWLLIHVMFLVGFRNRFVVTLQWLWTFLGHKQGAQLITDKN